jgi:hypothetical protein
VSAGSPHEYTAIGDCADVTLTDKETGAAQGQAQLRAMLGSVVVGRSASVVFPGDPATPTATSTTAAAQNAEQPVETSTPTPTEVDVPIQVVSPEATP